jgi:hypothetical protein
MFAPELGPIVIAGNAPTTIPYLALLRALGLAPLFSSSDWTATQRSVQRRGCCGFGASAVRADRGRSPTAATLQSEGMVGRFQATRLCSGFCGLGASAVRRRPSGTSKSLI